MEIYLGKERASWAMEGNQYFLLSFSYKYGFKTNFRETKKEKETAQKTENSKVANIKKKEKRKKKKSIERKNRSKVTE